MIFQFLINGLITGSIYALAALGFALVYNTTKIFHIAIAGVYVLSAYVSWHFTVNIGLPIVLAILISVILTALVSLLIERLFYFPLYRSNNSLNVFLITSLGLYIVLTNLIILIWGNESKSFSPEISNVYQFSEIVITYKQVYQFSISLIIIVTFFAFLNLSKTGLHIKAIRDDRELYQLFGFSLAKIRLIVFSLSGAIISIASSMNAWDVGMDPFNGMPMLLNSFVALIIGGLGRFESCVIGGILLGIIQSLVVWQWSSQWQLSFTFIILVIFLVVRPQGFIGEKYREV